MDDLNLLRELLPNEISELVALSEERLTLLQSLHIKIDEEADITIRKLADAIAIVNEGRKACHEDLETMLGQQVRVIQAYVNSLETRMQLVTECLEISQSQTQEKQTIATVGVDVKFKREELFARGVIVHQQRAIIGVKKLTCSYSVPVLGCACSDKYNFQALKDAVLTLNCAGYVTDMEIICVNDGCQQYSTFVSDSSSGSVRVFNIITGELQRTIGGGSLRAVYGLALLKTPVPLLFVSCSNLHKIIVFNAMSGELVKTIGEKGTNEGQLNGAWGLCVRPSQNANQAALLYVCDSGNHRVQVFDTESGRSVMTIGTGTAGTEANQFNYAYCVAIFEGNKVVEHPMLFVSDCNNHRIQSFDANTGAFIKSFGQGVAGAAACHLNNPKGVAVCAVDNISDPLLIVSEYDNHRIQIFNVVTGASVSRIGSKGSNGAQFNTPRGLRAFIVAKDEIVVYVADNGNKRVQKINISLTP